MILHISKNQPRHFPCLLCEYMVMGNVPLYVTKVDTRSSPGGQAGKAQARGRRCVVTYVEKSALSPPCSAFAVENVVMGNAPFINNYSNHHTVHQADDRHVRRRSEKLL